MIHLPDIVWCALCGDIAAFSPDAKYLPHGDSDGECIATGHTEDEAVVMRVSVQRPN